MPRREQDIFHDALALPPAQRDSFIRTACAGDADLLARLQRLLALAERSDTFLASADRVPDEPGPATRIGPYTLIELIGEGGFGRVYRAEQSEPLRRQVALKIIKTGMDTRSAIARFELERRALALMEHPHIARVLDAGETQSGRPYFVMELVSGIPLLRYCRTQRVPLLERLALFLQVCSAVGHAHRKGVIHRDLKPSNILVQASEDRPIAKVIDFGIAKLATEPLGADPEHSRLLMLMGTPPYLSPEQAGLRVSDIDTRTDIYSLGAILYELLVGVRLFDFQSGPPPSYAEIEAAIRLQEPVPPSRRFDQLPLAAKTAAASENRTSPARLRSYIRGDLDSIVLKCLEKDRERRYETVDALRQDIERFLRQEPIGARPPTWHYRAWKYARRHKQSVTLAAVAFLLLLVYAVRAQQRLMQERNDARREVLEARQAAQILSDIMVPPAQGSAPAAGDSATTPNQALRIAEQIRRDFEQSPALRVQALNALGHVYLQQGRPGQAQALLLQAIAANDQSDPTHSAIGQSLLQLASDYENRGELVEAARILTEFVADCRRSTNNPPAMLGPPLSSLSHCLLRLEQIDQAERSAHEALANRLKVFGPDNRDVGICLVDLGSVLWVEGDLVAAANQFDDALRMFHRVNPDDDIYSATTKTYLAVVRSDQGRLEEAATLARAAVVATQAQLGNQNWRTARAYLNLAAILRRQNQYDDAADALQHTQSWLQTNVPARNPLAISLVLERARLALATGKDSDAETLFRRALSLQLASLPPNGWQVATTRSLLGEALLRNRQYAEAEKMLVAAAAVLPDVPGPRGAEFAATRTRLAQLHARLSSP